MPLPGAPAQLPLIHERSVVGLPPIDERSTLTVVRSPAGAATPVQVRIVADAPFDSIDEGEKEQDEIVGGESVTVRVGEIVYVAFLESVAVTANVFSPRGIAS